MGLAEAVPPGQDSSRAMTVPTPVQPPAETTRDLKTRALTQPPETLGICLSSRYPTVWGVLMEINYPESLTCFAGSQSYYSRRSARFRLVCLNR